MNKLNDSEQVIVKQILINCNLKIDEIKLFQTNDRVKDYLLDDVLLLRISSNPLQDLDKLNQVGVFKGVQKIHFFGNVSVNNFDYHYLVLDFFQGMDLYDALPILTDNELVKIGKDLAETLLRLHQIKGDYYDIGHYIPTVPNYKSSWKNGHLAYVDFLKSQITSLNFPKEIEKVIESAFKYIDKHIDSLDYENGAVLLHNDLHPKNIIISNNYYRGLIDWECSQFGEYDFDFVHLLQWCIYPKEPSRSFNILLKSAFENYKNILHIPRLSERFTIYQLEHEINQIIWNNGKEIENRIMRINGWISGKIEQIFQSFSEDYTVIK